MGNDLKPKLFFSAADRPQSCWNQSAPPAERRSQLRRFRTSLPATLPSFDKRTLSTPAGRPRGANLLATSALTTQLVVEGSDKKH